MQPVSPKRTVDIAASMLRKAILNGVYPPESNLPAERKLAAQLAINRLTLRSALSQLEAEGLIQPHHGRGIVVLDYKEFGSLNLIAHFDGTSEDPEVKQAIEETFILRKHFASEAVAFASRRANAGQINMLKAIVHQQLDVVDDQNFFEGDLQFNAVLVQSAHSLPIQLLYNSFERIIRSHPSFGLSFLENRSAVITNYQGLVSLIKNRDPELARAALLGYSTPSEQEEIRKIIIQDWYDES
ncbi:MAG: hypothetical protein CMK59_11795 [Proteobacteria bacterium]|nr:hypothetical protein [Pseudomonadota bacterium]